MASLVLEKRCEEAADALTQFVKDATREERTVQIAEDMTAREIVIEGDFERFVLSLMDMWGGHLRFVFRDTEVKDDEAKEARATILEYVPELAHQLYAKAQLRVYRREIITTETIRRRGRQELSRETRDAEEWTEITEEFAKIMQRESLGVG